MKTKQILISFLLCISVSIYTHAQITSVANGNWTSPATWGGVPPTPGADVIINHAVVLDIDYGYASGSITINGAGSLNGNTPARALALIAGGNGTLTVSGGLSIARLAFFSGSITNNGTITSDSLFNSITFNNNTGAVVNAAQLMNNTGANLTNNGTITTTNFLNIETVTNNNMLAASDFMNCKSFTNAATATIDIANDFLNSDSLASPATFVNNGTVNVGNDWLNTESVSGSGKFCILNNTSNTGLMTGTFDFCDQTGGNIDANTGTIQPTITYCQYPCGMSTSEEQKELTASIYPNPNNGFFTVYNNVPDVDIEIFNLIGKQVYKSKLTATNNNIDLRSEAEGIYFYKLLRGNNVLYAGKIIIK